MKIKICGIKERQNCEQIASLNIDYMGLIFAKSPRQVSFDLAQELSLIIRNSGKKAVGVFVDESDEFILKHASFLDVLQCYKKVSKDLYTQAKALKLELWQVISVDEKLKYDENINADLVLFDTKGKFKGGNGTSFNWNLLQDYPKDFALAGGIGLDNIEQACKFKPKIIDINSRVENALGLKDKALIMQLLKKVGR
ncbi:N-(5'-phosphoribosyl)anthranilate isomerase [Campylobacter sp. MIT 12-5580]|uniref:phosphoribosylanthranilate isomerase n=1 Tax=Campylobacter sp. MIT 12-5580 TaxID=2040651 RepID=UPI0010F63EC0|nr:phosphoribosylanthranilate isomerase [Campylobacter sp. MIT 12-5580]TKX30228.1 N-(5'-phosphoribosyl)anthranilate isomerase [Campylobacter sp. MIT 12-5580]